MASPMANLLFTLGSFILGFSLPRLVYEHYKSKVEGSLTAIALSMITLGMLFELQDLWIQMSKNMPFSVQSLFWGFFAGNMIALLYYGAIGVGRVSIKAGRLVGRAYHEVKALRKEEKRLEKEEKEEIKDLKEVKHELDEAKKEIESKLEELEKKLAKDVKVEELDIKEVLDYIRESQRILQEYMRKLGSFRYRLMPQRLKQIGEEMTKELKEKAKNPLKKIESQTKRVIDDIENSLKVVEETERKLRSTLKVTAESVENMSAYIEEFSRFSQDFANIVSEYNNIEKSLAKFETEISERYHLEEVLSQEGKGLKDLQDMSRRLREIVSESKRAFSEVHNLSRSLSGLKFDEQKLRRLKDHIKSVINKDAYSVKLADVTRKQIEKIRKQLVVFEDVQFVDLKKAKAPHEVIQAFGRGVDRAMSIIEESLVALGNAVRSIKGEMEEDLNTLLISLEEVEKEKEKLEKWEEYLEGITKKIESQDEDIKDIEEDIKDIEHIFIKHKVKDYAKALEPLRRSIESLKRLSESFSEIDKVIRGNVSNLKKYNLRRHVEEISKLRGEANKILDRLIKISYNESMRYRKAHLKILNELRNLYNSIVSMEIRTGLKDVLRRKTPSAKKAIPGKPRPV
ncbi:hypothetical protein [Pyrococcus kukulkanii]|uniref:hypothetical protein n=1 Tax=Pyrococcus kukulkanii TaxID=1609559 RepID=UPI0035691929